jgi:hypothetical protein
MGQHVIHDTQKNYKEISMGTEEKKYFKIFLKFLLLQNIVLVY